MRMVYPEHFDIDGNRIMVGTCRHCENQVRIERGKTFHYYNYNANCCYSAQYYLGIEVPGEDYKETSQEIRVLNKDTGEVVVRTFQEWMRRAVKLSETWNLDFESLEVIE